MVIPIFVFSRRLAPEQRVSWHPVLSPRNLIINWQCTLIAESLSQGAKHEAHKRDGSLCREPATIKTLLIKITGGTNQQLKLIVFIVPRVKTTHTAG